MLQSFESKLPGLGLLCICLGLSACSSKQLASVDPLEPLNRKIYTFNSVSDKLLLRPVARLYDTLLPKPVHQVISNVFQNLSELPNIANGLLQWDFASAAHDSARFLINSSLGLGGTFDLASSLKLPYRQLDFGLTFAKWGVKKSTYIILPLIGPSTIRDGIGKIAYLYSSPSAYLHSVKLRNSLTGLNIVNTRSQYLDAEEVMNVASVDEYVFVRDAYLQRRAYMINQDNDAAELSQNPQMDINAELEELTGPPD